MEDAAAPAFVAAFRARAGENGALSFADFMELALYDATAGYYRRDRARVGYGAGTDFFTASTSGPIFGELIAAAAVTLLGERAAGEHTFVEIGAETAGGVLAGVAQPFAGVRTVRVGEPLVLRGKCVVFSNELFDAQPFHRYVFRRGAWQELGVAWRDGRFVEVEIGTARHAALPPTAPEGYAIDAPWRATQLAETLVAQAWTGVFLACDYGKTWRELVEATPAGTARAYHRHTQSNDLLARPGEQDLTCHVCWDFLARALEAGGFTGVGVESQEAFFVRHAGALIEAISRAEAARLSQRKLALLQLLHPAHLGQKFQVLHGRR